MRGVISDGPDRVTVTPGIPARVLSVTIPLTAPVVAVTVCAFAAEPNVTEPNANNQRRSKLLPCREESQVRGTHAAILAGCNADVDAFFVWRVEWVTTRGFLHAINLRVPVETERGQ